MVISILYPVDTFVMYNMTPKVIVLWISKSHGPMILYNGANGVNWDAWYRGTLGLYKAYLKIWKFRIILLHIISYNHWLWSTFRLDFNLISLIILELCDFKMIFQMHKLKCLPINWYLKFKNSTSSLGNLWSAGQKSLRKSLHNSEILAAPILSKRVSHCAPGIGFKGTLRDASQKLY